MAMQTADKALVDQIKIHIQANEDVEALAMLRDLDVNDLIGEIGLELLHFAVKTENRAVTQHLIDSGVDVGVFYKHEHSPLVKAVIQDADEKTIEAIVYPITRCYRGGILGWALSESLCKFTILSLILESLRKNSLANTEIAVQKLIHLNVKLCHAARLKDVEILKMMLNRGCLISDFDPYTGRTALHVAVMLRDFVTIKFLVDSGADINVTDAGGLIPFALARDYGDSVEEIEILNYLLDQGSSLKIICVCDIDQKWYILNRGKRAIVRTLISRRDIDFSTKDQSGRTSLHCISWNEKLSDDRSIVEDLKQCKIDVNILNDDNESPLHGAVSVKNSRLAMYLLENGANVNQKNIHNVTPLHLAVHCSSYLRETNPGKKNIYNLIELLLQYGADPQLVIKNDCTVIYRISRHQCYDLAKPILASLALHVDRGILVTELMSNQINSDQILKKEFELCQRDLREIKATRFNGSLTAFNLMFDSEKKIMLCARDKEVFDKLTKFYGTISSDSYFFDLLKRRIENILSAIEIRLKATERLCRILKFDYYAFPVVIDKIISYFDNQDLQNIIQV